jgi:type I restriction enzyme R subunit
VVRQIDLKVPAPRNPGALEELREQAHANEIENFRYGFDQKFEAAVVDRQSANEELFKKLMDDSEFNAAVRDLLLKKVYERLADEPAA